MTPFEITHPSTFSENDLILQINSGKEVFATEPKEEDTTLKLFSAGPVMAYLRKQLELKELNLLAEYKGNASRNMMRLGQTLDRGRWKSLLDNLERLHPAVFKGLKNKFLLQQ